MSEGDALLNKIWGEIEDFVRLASSRISHICLINNAAFQAAKYLTELDANDITSSLAVNLYAPLVLSNALATRSEAEQKSILNIGSVHAHVTKPKFGIYAASKAGIESLTRSLAIELGPLGVRVNCLNPAAVETPMLVEGLEQASSCLSELARLHPSGSIGNPNACADLVFYLSTSTDNFFTGSIINYSGAIDSVLLDIETR
jgi:NAD(P)-dependent dehydrogenase (short-subunit alcohol dehydrogenase family)